MAVEAEIRAAWAGCEHWIAGSGPGARDPRATLLALAGRAPSLDDVDTYGEGALVERLESRVASELGKEAALWLPSGTMAQQIALRVHAQARGIDAVAFHPYCHLDTHEERGYEWLHGLHAVVVGERSRLITAADIEGLRDPIAALLLELPQRDLGGQLPDWDQLVAACEAGRSRGAALHLDGARLWQCAPHFGRPLHEIAALFDSVYVSFYKDLGAPAGCALAGTRQLVDEARVWQIRHGGRLFSAFPFLLAAEQGLDEILPRMPVYVARARELGAALGELDGVTVVPDPPQTAMFHTLIRRPLEPLRRAVLDIARKERVWLGAYARPTEDPDVQRAELTIADAGLAVPVEDARRWWEELLRQAAGA